MADNNDMNLDRDWSVTLNVSGIQAATGKKSEPLPKGFYKATITDAYVNAERNANRVVFRMTVSEGGFAGSYCTTGLNKPKDASDNVRYYWRALAESVGFTSAQLDAGEVVMTPASFIDRVAHIRYTPKEESGSGYTKVDFLTPAEWTQQAQMGNANAGNANAAPANTLGGGNTTSKADVMGRLGL